MVSSCIAAPDEQSERVNNLSVEPQFIRRLFRIFGAYFCFIGVKVINPR